MIEKRSLPQNIVTYPAHFAPPLQDGYSMAVQHFRLPTRMQGGWTRVRRLDADRLRSLTLSFMMTNEEFEEWHAWVHLHGFDWFLMELITDGVLQQNPPWTTLTALRFNTGVQFTFKSFKSITLSIGAELYLRSDQVEVENPSPPGETVPGLVVSPG